MSDPQSDDFLRDARSDSVERLKVGKIARFNAGGKRYSRGAFCLYSDLEAAVKAARALRAWNDGNPRESIDSTLASLCPECGSVPFYNENLPDGLYQVGCVDDHCGRDGGIHSTFDGAIQSWNDRTKKKKFIERVKDRPLTPTPHLISAAHQVAELRERLRKFAEAVREHDRTTEFHNGCHRHEERPHAVITPSRLAFGQLVWLASEDKEETL